MAAASIGRVVHYVDEEGQIHPAEIVAVLSENCVNLVVTLDGENDSRSGLGGSGSQLHAWKTGVEEVSEFDAENWTPFSWHWPPRVE